MIGWRPSGKSSVSNATRRMAEMPVPLQSGISYFDGPPVITCAAFAMREGRFTEPTDPFVHPFWNRVRDTVSDKAIGMRRQGFFGAALLLVAELEYIGIMESLKALEPRFRVRTDS